MGFRVVAYPFREAEAFREESQERIGVLASKTETRNVFALKLELLLHVFDLNFDWGPPRPDHNSQGLRTLTPSQGKEIRTKSAFPVRRPRTSRLLVPDNQGDRHLLRDCAVADADVFGWYKYPAQRLSPLDRLGLVVPLLPGLPHPHSPLATNSKKPIDTARATCLRPLRKRNGNSNRNPPERDSESRQHAALRRFGGNGESETRCLATGERQGGGAKQATWRSPVSRCN